MERNQAPFAAIREYQKHAYHIHSAVFVQAVAICAYLGLTATAPTRSTCPLNILCGAPVLAFTQLTVPFSFPQSNVLSSAAKHAAMDELELELLEDGTKEFAPSSSASMANKVLPSYPSIFRSYPPLAHASICLPLRLNSRLVHSDLDKAYARSGVQRVPWVEAMSRILASTSERRTFISEKGPTV